MTLTPPQNNLQKPLDTTRNLWLDTHMNNTTATPAMTAAATEKLRNGLFTCVSNMANMRRDADPTATEDEIFESIKASLIRMMSK